MLSSFGRVRSRRLTALLLLAGLCCCFWVFRRRRGAADTPLDAHTLEGSFPLAWKHLHMFNGIGGAWYLPSEWVGDERAQPRSILEAARVASWAAKADPRRQMDHSSVPLIVHQTWATARLDNWKPSVLLCVERWLLYAVSPEQGRPMAYFFWDDDGILSFIREYEPDFVDSFLSFFSPVERADIFRILVCNVFGGIYGDVDTEPLRHPAMWIEASDLAAWRDPENGASWGLNVTASPPPEREGPVHLVVGLEADTDPGSDSYWRMGYSHPVQLTQWALASAPQHPALARFMDNIRLHVDDIKRLSIGPGGDLIGKIDLDPLTRTGPAAITVAVSSWLEEHAGLRWNAVTGLKDGGKAKLVDDVLVLPITGFSPGRGQYGNMGSKPTTHADARLIHHAQGSWRHFDLKVEVGKFCRTAFGLCKDWSKVPS